MELRGEYGGGRRLKEMGFDCRQQAIQENQREVIKTKTSKRWREEDEGEEEIPLGRNHQLPA